VVTNRRKRTGEEKGTKPKDKEGVLVRRKKLCSLSQPTFKAGSSKVRGEEGGRIEHKKKKKPREKGDRNTTLD